MEFLSRPPVTVIVKIQTLFFVPESILVPETHVEMTPLLV